MMIFVASGGRGARPVRLRRRVGEGDGKERSGVGGACGCEVPPVIADDAVGNGEAESGSAPLRGVEGIEELG